jgi:cellulose synthase/poly-beta-1,6-N-acetylglucosamine synthase-like glycosyltransferase
MIVIYILYWLAALGLFIYGMNMYVLVRSFRKGRREHLARMERVRREYWASVTEDELPVVTIQLPLYNERFVAGRLIHAISKLEYPRDKLEVQVLDDSNDETVDIVKTLVKHYRGLGLDVEHIRRRNREGYKAGALRDGLKTSRGELVAVFDADFVPEPDFLRKTVPFFVDEKIGLVQTRWGHVNESYSMLTQAQAIAIDGHFGVEQAGRRWGGFFLNFNGTAGIWRRKAIDDAGGWHADTLTEDLDLSYRAQLEGYEIEYLIDVEVPAEIPADITAFKSQQRRWAKGSIQTAIKLIPKVLKADRPVFTKIQAMIHLTHYMVHPLMLTIAILAVPLLAFWQFSSAPLPFAIMVVVLAMSACGPSFLYISAQRALRRDWKSRIKWLPILMVVGTGIAVSNTRAVLEAFLGIKSGFVRTPKAALSGTRRVAATQSYKLPIDITFVFEAFLAIYSLVGLYLYAEKGKYLIGPFLLLYAIGFGTMAFASMRDVFRRLRRTEPVEEETLDPVIESEVAYGEVLTHFRDATETQRIRAAAV